MAATAAGRRLTEAHRIAQLRLGAATVTRMRTAFRFLNPNAVDATFTTWLAKVLPIVITQRATSTLLAGNYIEAFRAAELAGTATELALPAAAMDMTAVATSLWVTGPVRIKSATARGFPLARAATLALDASSAAGMRHALDGGRQLIVDTTELDSEAHGWARATSGKACHFCAMLASRGPVYTADGVHFRSHDGCSCSAEPVYRRDGAWPAGAREYRKVWDTATRGLAPGDDAVNAFRKALAT